MRLARLVAPGSSLSLDDIDPDDTGGLKGKKDPKTQKLFDKDIARLVELQDKLLGESKQALLVVLQAMDTAGKDGVLRKVGGPLDSRGVSVKTFKAPSSEELGHDYLWRCHAHVPPKGQMVFFNRSHYEDVLVVRVLGLVPKATWKKRFDHINDFERMLTDEGVRIVKLFLHISKDEQKRRLQERLDDADKNWKFVTSDLDMRKKWDDFMKAYEEMLARTSTKHAPWRVIPANNKWFRDVAVARVLVEALEEMAPEYPPAKVDVTKIVIPD